MQIKYPKIHVLFTRSNSSYIAANVWSTTIQMLFGNWTVCDLCVRKCVECPVQQWNVLMEYSKHFNVFYNLVYLVECFWQWKWVEMWDNKRRRLCHCLQIILFHFGIATKTNQTCKMKVETHLSFSSNSIRIGPLPQIKIWCDVIILHHSGWLRTFRVFLIQFISPLTRTHRFMSHSSFPSIMYHTSCIAL